MTIFKRLLKNIFRTAMKDANGTFIRWQTVHDLFHRIMPLKELRDFWPSCGGLVVDEGLQIAGDDYDTIFLLQDVLSQRLGRDCHFPLFVSLWARRNDVKNRSIPMNKPLISEKN